MADRGHELTDEKIKKMEDELRKEYTQAAAEIENKLKDYMDRFTKKDAIWQKWVQEGKKTPEEYARWRTGQMAVGKRWEKMKDSIADDLLHVNDIATGMVTGQMPEIFATNANYAIYSAESDAGIDTGLTLYNRDAVNTIIQDEPDLLLPPGQKVSAEIAAGTAKRWEREKIQSVMLQGILQGESIPNIARRLAEKVADSNFKAAVRNARTMSTNAQNLGRYHAYERLEKRGVGVTLEWAATLDNRTRHEHRMMHGQRRNVGEPFDVDGIKIMYPAQTGKFMGVSDIPQRMIWNCRCTILAWVKGYEHDTITKSDKMGDMTFDEWLQAKEQPEPILKQKEKGDAISGAFNKQYAGRPVGPARPLGKAITQNTKAPDKEVVKSTSTENERGRKILEGVYENHRTSNNMTSVPLEELKQQEQKFNVPRTVDVNYGKMSPDAADAWNSALEELTKDFDTPLTRVRTMTRDEFMRNPRAFAYVDHDYTVDTAEMVINPTKCKDLEALSNRIKELSDNGYAVKIDPENAGKYVATHEFAHTLLHMMDPIKNKTNFVNANYDNIRSARKEIDDIYKRYSDEVGKLTEKTKKYELDTLLAPNVDEAEKAQKLYLEADAELSKIKISDYSLADSDEFMAESFTEQRIGESKNPYAKEVMDVLIRHFGRK